MNHIVQRWIQNQSVISDWHILAIHDHLLSIPAPQIEVETSSICWFQLHSFLFLPDDGVVSCCNQSKTVDSVCMSCCNQSKTVSNVCMSSVNAFRLYHISFIKIMHIHKTLAFHEFCGFLDVTWLTNILSGCSCGNSTVNATTANSERECGWGLWWCRSV